MNPQQHHHRRHGLVERCSTIRACDPCKRKKKLCNGQRPCSHCDTKEASCVYSVVPDHARGVFTTSTARRLSSGSACETCRRRKTKCDGASPCSYCAANQLECINLQASRKRSTSSIPLYSSPLTHTAGGVPDHTMDRIEDRLQRIEKLMVAFDTGKPYIRPHRHSVQGIAVAKEQVELRTAKGKSPPPPPFAMYSLSPSSSTSSAGFDEEPNKIPSCMDQLSKRTFNHAAMDHGNVHYPIYPLTLPSSQ